ncbi:MAG: TetR/AcrR family transcriptional regulator [Clostridiales bacterium]|nr:TetR/AcrR family transcriptional regulator [Clostridiales bacterium]
MANIGHGKKFEVAKAKLLQSAIKLFLEKGYLSTKITDITGLAKVDSNAVARVFGDKETLVSELVSHVLSTQFEMASELVNGKSEDPLFLYITETVLQLYMSESSEHMREMYNMSYTFESSKTIIYETITGKLEKILKDYLPAYDSKDFYELEIASGGIMRSFITVPCDRYFTMKRKVDKYLEYILLLFRVPSDKAEQIKEFVLQFDYESLVDQVVQRIINRFDKNN